jgi:16S rRNA (guanine527-N7)-methyltransferase
MGVADTSADVSDAIAALVAGAGALGLILGPNAISQFEEYLSTLLLWRRRLSLISVGDVRTIVRNHVLDCLTVARFVRSGFRIADIGSGAGFPGIPLAIACPDAQVDLIESRRKKANFLREVVRNARLGNAQVIEARAESIGAEFVDVYDIAVSRAVWEIPRLLQVCARLLKRGGLAIAMKGPKALTEAASHLNGFSEPQTVPYDLSGGARRALLLFRKE